MTAADCRAPRTCPVPDPGPGVIDARHLRIAEWPADRPFFRAYQLRYGYDTFAPARGDTRFAPLLPTGGGPAVPTLYGGTSEIVALLETVFHDVTAATGPRVIYETYLRNRGLAYVHPPRALRLLDLRDGALARLGLRREQLVATTPARYPCTRQWAAWLHGRRPGGARPDGIVWSSRQAELMPLAAGESTEVFVLFGDRAPSAPGSYALTSYGVRNLVEGPGMVLVEELAERLDARVERG